jgi:hypothetical protein
MRTWGWLFSVLGWAACVLLGLAALLMVLEPAGAPAALSDSLRRLAHFAPWVYWAWGLGLIVLPGLAVGLAAVKALRRDYVLFPGERGLVMVDVSSIEECLRKVLSEEEGVGRARVAVRIGGSELLCAVTVWLEASSDVVGRIRQMETRLLEYYRYVLPESKPLRVEIKTRLIYQRRASAAQPGRPAAGQGPTSRGESRTEDYYGGPRYPVDAGDADPGSMTSS